MALTDRPLLEHVYQVTPTDGELSDLFRGAIPGVRRLQPGARANRPGVGGGPRLAVFLPARRYFPQGKRREARRAASFHMKFPRSRSPVDRPPPDTGPWAWWWRTRMTVALRTRERGSVAGTRVTRTNLELSSSTGGGPTVEVT